MAVLKASRKKLRPGDIFTMRFPPVGYLYGRVIEAGMDAGPMGPGSNLVYVYDYVGEEVESLEMLDRNLRRDRLMFGPVFINRLPWSRGYFHTVYWQELREFDRLAGHYFIDPVRNIVRAQDGLEIVPPTDARFGFWGLDSYRSLDARISDELGIPLADD
jgi:hypothetical protein